MLVRRWTLLALETNALRAGDRHVENVRSNFSHTHTHSYNVATRTYVEMIASHSYSPPKTGAAEIRKVSRCTTTSSMELNWPYYWQLPANRCGLTIHATPGIRKQKPQKSTNVSILHSGGRFLAVARTTPQTRKGRCSVEEQSFGMYNIRVHCIVFELCVTEERIRRKKMNKIDILAFGFLGLVKG